MVKLVALLPALLVVAVSIVPPARADFIRQPANDSVFRLRIASESGRPDRSDVEVDIKNDVSYRCEVASWHTDTFTAEAAFCSTDDLGGWQPHIEQIFWHDYVSGVEDFSRGTDVDTVIGDLTTIRFSLDESFAAGAHHCAAFVHGYERGVGVNRDYYAKALNLYVCDTAQTAMTDERFREALESFSVEGEFESLL